MELCRLELVDWRNYVHARVELGSGVNVLVGPNAQGKTNLVEAVHYLSVGASHRVASDAPLVRAGAEAAVIRAEARVEDDRRMLVEYEVRPGGRNRARVDGAVQARTRDAIGQVRSVMVAPEDLSLVRGDPSDRRRFLDELLGQRRRAYLTTRMEYERILRQRNALLRAGRAGSRTDPTLDTWTEAAVTTGATLVAARIAAVHALAAPAAAAYADLVAASPQREATGALTLAYQLSTGRLVAAQPGAGVPDPADLADELREGFRHVAVSELQRGVTLAGPHRDELVLTLNDLPARGYASHGETWSLVLALRLASREVLTEVGSEPVMLLDDVFAELDETRRQRLADHCTTFQQVLVTTAVGRDVPLSGTRHRVEAGSVTTTGDAAAVHP